MPLQLQPRRRLMSDLLSARRFRHHLMQRRSRH
jgi:hypothetical protein